MHMGRGGGGAMAGKLGGRAQDWRGHCSGCRLEVAVSGFPGVLD